MKNFFKENDKRLKMIWNNKIKKWEFQIQTEPKQKEKLKKEVIKNRESFIKG